MEELAELECKHYSYDYEGDKLVNYNGKSFAYNSIGNPTIYSGKVCEWQYGTRLTKFGDTTFAYNGLGRRTSKGSTTFTYDNDGRLIKQTDGTDVLEFIYDNSGLAGVKYGGATYFYRKDTQGNIVAILDSNGSTVVKYVYDAWGNHAITDNDGNDIESGIGALNPFRYRGYYYDTETGLYYLQTRYYDPEVGRFISQDSIEYADPESINGLNLYAYCGNNPVMNVDPTGELFFTILGLIFAASAVGAVVGVASTFVGDIVNSAVSGRWQFSSWENYLGNALGGAVGGVISLVNPFAGIVVGNTLGTFAGLAIGKATGSNDMSWREIGFYTAASFGISMLTAGFSKYLKIPGITKGSHSWQQVFKAGFTKFLRYGFSMSAKTIAKGVGYLFVSSFSIGFLLNNILQGLFGYGYKK